MERERIGERISAKITKVNRSINGMRKVEVWALKKTKETSVRTDGEFAGSV